MYQISNDQIKIKLNALGAALTSICDSDGIEYLWQGDPQYWTGQAPNLFPYIGRLTNNQYYLNGEVYHMNIHGFARNTVFKVSQISDSSILFRTEASEDTYRIYPYLFEFQVHYEIRDNKIQITYKVANKDNSIMYFGVGGHPGFRVPFVDGDSFEDYFIEFIPRCNPLRICFSENRMLTEKRIPFELDDTCKLSLAHSLFDDDAIILTETSKKVKLRCRNHNKWVMMSFPDMPYIGFWHVPKKDAPYVCIEPWSSLPSREGVVEDLAKQPGLIALKPSEEYTNQITITLGIN